MSEHSQPPRLPIWARVAGERDGAQGEDLVIIKPGEPGYDHEYACGVRDYEQFGEGIPYAFPDEIATWDRDQNISDQGER